MAQPGAQPGNQNAKKSRLFEQSLIREIKQRDLAAGDGETLRAVAAAILDKALAGDRKCAMDIRDTLDGRPTQVIATDPDNPLGFELIERRIVDPKA